MIFRILPLLALAGSAAAQPMTNPAIFARGGVGLGGIVVGAVVGGVAFAALKSAGEEARFRTGKPAVEKAFVAGGAVAGLAIFCVCAFVL
jgi:hypothetical protein